jgi:hypothetical protein
MTLLASAHSMETLMPHLRRPRLARALMALAVSASAFACKAPADPAATAPPGAGASGASAAAKAGAAGASAAAKAGAPESAAEAVNFVVRVVPGAAKAGAESTTVVEVTPKPGFKMNLDFPARLRITEPGATKPAKEVLGKDDAEVTAEVLRFKVALTAEQAGAAAVGALADFSVCNENACKLIRGEKLAWTVDVQE